jgi:hypothetical protein
VIVKIIIAVVCPGGAVWCFRTILRLPTHTVFLRDHGLRIGDRSRWIEWAEISRIRQRLGRQAIELLDKNGDVLGSVEYQIQDVGLVFDAIRRKALADKMPLTDPPWGNHGTLADWIGNAVVLTGLTAGGLWILPRWKVLVLVGVAVILFGILIEAKQDIRCIDLAPDCITLRSALRSRTINHGEILAIALTLAPASGGNARLDVAVTLRDGLTMSILPPKADPQDVYLVVRNWMNR